MATVTVPHAPASAGEVRRLLVADLLAGAVDSTDSLEEAALLVTELVGNAVRHARPLPDGWVLVSWRIEGTRLHIRVTDGGSPLAEPHVAHAGPQDIRGRGLSIVDALALQWGVERGRGSSTVWATLTLGSPRGGQPEEPNPGEAGRMVVEGVPADRGQRELSDA